MQDELALRDEIGLAGLVDQLGHLQHRRGAPAGACSRVKVIRPKSSPSAQTPMPPISSVLALMPEEVHLSRDRAAPGWPRRPGMAGAGSGLPHRGMRAGRRQQSDTTSIHTNPSSCISPSPYQNCLCLRRVGNVMPPVRNTRMPSSTERSGKNASSRGQITTSPRYR